VDIDLQLVKNCELIDEHYFTLAADKNRHKAQVYFCFDPQKVTKGTSIHVKAATITHTGRVMNISVDSMENIEVLPHPIFTELVIGELSWPIANVKVEKNEQEKDGIEAAAGENEETYATIKEPIDAVGTTTRKATRKGK
jgi:hypothetical protein